uniref:Serine/threonine-protein kinase SBK1 n=1 Tax=Cacopsylla melanoneura TaxID=428564 RepID=A0A8D8PQR6_9HEMI
MMRHQRSNTGPLVASKDGPADNYPPPNKGKKMASSNIHKIREFELEQVILSEEFDILQIVGEGWFGKILLVEHRVTDTEMVLKALPKPYVTLKDFYTEFHYGLHLGSHKNIITTYDVAFETAGFHVFSQEYAPLGDLTSNVSENGIGELYTKRVAKQLAAALGFVHMKDLVHRDVKLDNVLVFKSDFSRVKLCDFGETRKTGTLVRRRNEWLPYSPPDVLEMATDDTYKAETSQDIWQFAIVVFVCLTGCLPWQKAAPDDPRYCRYLYWINSTGVLMPIRQPKLFKILSNKAQRWFRKFLEPKPDKRPNDLNEMYKYVEDRWLARSLTSSTNDVWNEEDGLCPSMYSFHSSADEKNKLLQTLTAYGIETTVDRGAKKDRIKAWIQSSVIEEDKEEDEGGSGSVPTRQNVNMRRRNVSSESESRSVSK